MFLKFDQLSLFDNYNSLISESYSNRYKIINLLKEYFNISDFIPLTLYNAYNTHLGRKRDFSLKSILSALIIKQMLNFEKTSQFINILHLSKELRDICGFRNRIPSESFFSRFKSEFNHLLEDFFHKLVEVTEPICRKINDELSSTLIYDTSGIEAYVKENNPKFINSEIKKVKYFDKDISTANAAGIVYKNLPKTASANSDVKKTYINGHFCYAYKFGILTNGLGIIRELTFLKDLDSQSDDPEEEKYNSDTHSLKPIINSFIKDNSKYNFHTFIADSEFDNYYNYTYLLKDLEFEKAIISLNKRGGNNSQNLEYNAYGYPLCPMDNSTPFIYWGKSPYNNTTRFKFICPQYQREGNKLTSLCSTPCNNSKYPRTKHVYPHQDLRTYPGIVRHSPEWDALYKKRATIERTISNLKLSYGNSRTFSNRKEHIKSDLILSACSQLIILILADKLSINKPIKTFKQFLTAS